MKLKLIFLLLLALQLAMARSGSGSGSGLKGRKVAPPAVEESEEDHAEESSQEDVKEEDEEEDEAETEQEDEPGSYSNSDEEYDPSNPIRYEYIPHPNEKPGSGRPSLAGGPSSVPQSGGPPGGESQEDEPFSNYPPPPPQQQQGSSSFGGPPRDSFGVNNGPHYGYGPEQGQGQGPARKEQLGLMDILKKGFFMSRMGTASGSSEEEFDEVGVVVEEDDMGVEGVEDSREARFVSPFRQHMGPDLYNPEYIINPSIANERKNWRLRHRQPPTHLPHNWLYKSLKGAWGNPKEYDINPWSGHHYYGGHYFGKNW